MRRSVLCLLLGLPTIIGGCMGIAGAMLGSALTGAAAGEAFGAAAHTSTAVLCSTPDSITVEYYATDEDRKPREAALRLVAEHCNGDYRETQTLDRGVWHAVDARCSQPDPAAEPAPPCEYKATERTETGSE